MGRSISTIQGNNAPSIEISFNNALLTSLSVEDVTQEEVIKYGNEIDVLRQKWDSLMDIENEKWHSGPRPLKQLQKLRRSICCGSRVMIDSYLVNTRKDLG
jgi:hypothetical protein